MNTAPMIPRKPFRRGQTRRRGFTLIELVLVIGIIVFLAAMLVVGGQYLIRRSRYDKTEMLYNRLRAAAQEYKQDHRRFPEAWDHDQPEKETQQILYGVSDDRAAGLWQYVKVESGEAKSTDDGWGEPIRLEFNPDRQQLWFVSAGPDKGFDTDGDNIRKPIH